MKPKLSYVRCAILFKTTLTAAKKCSHRWVSMLLLPLMLGTQPAIAQTLYGTESFGGSIVAYDIPTKQIAIVAQAPGALSTKFIIGSNTILYSSIRTGGAFGFGGIIAFDRTNASVTTIINFDAASGTDQSASVLRIKAGNGIIYGNGAGGLFAFTPATSAYHLVDGSHDFGNGNLIQAADNKLYGTTSTGGLFSFDLTTSTYMLINAAHDFGRDIMQAGNGRIYGFTVGDIPGRYDHLYSFDLSTNTFEKYTLDAILGEFPDAYAGAPLVEKPDGKLYGTITSGAFDGNGGVFSFDPVTFQVTLVLNFDKTVLMSPQAGLMVAPNGDLYGTYIQSRDLNGAVFQLGSTYSVSTIFSEDNISYTPLGSTLVELPPLDIPCNLAATISIDSILCANTTVNGKVEVSGGAGGYLYSVDGGDFSTDPGLNELGAGDHTVIVKDSRGCIVTLPFTLGEPPVLSFTTTVTKLKPNWGTITVNATGGTPPYQYKLNQEPFQAANSYTVKAGTYYVFVTDANSCPVARQQVIVIKPSRLTVNVYTALDVTCHGTPGYYNIFPEGGVEPYAYKADDGDWQSTNNFVLYAGNHTLSIKDGEGTIAETMFRVTEPPLLTATYSYCDNSDGSVTLTVNAAGGTPPYKYALNTPYGPGNTFTVQHGQAFNARVLDSRGCIIEVPGVIGNEVTACKPGNKQKQQALVVKASLQVYAIPNPTATSFKLLVDGAPEKNVLVTVTDISGRKLYQQVGKGSRQYVFGQSFAPGVYLVRVQQDDQSKTLTVIKK
jgi:hypothetical protein